MDTTKYDGNKVVSWDDVGWKPKEYKTAPASVQMKMSDAIRRGLPHVEETDTFQGCAIACASYSVRGFSHHAGYGDYWQPEDAANHFRIPLEHVEHISRAHFTGLMTREQCADWLEARGY